MAKQTINLGTAPTGVGGDTPRTAFTKTQGNFDEIYTALGGTTIPAALPVNKGGTGGTTAATARTALGLKTASTYDLIGAMGTGIMERGYNSNGEFCRYANGIIQQWGFIIFGQGPILSTISASVVFPTLFYDTSYTIVLTPQVSNNGAGSQSCLGEFNANGPYLTKYTDTCAVGMYTYRYAQTSQVVLQWFATGRWQAK